MNDTQVDHTLCMAHGCNMIGTTSLGTKGGDWCCFIHARAERDDWAAISSELNRLGWLVDAVKRLRAGAGPNTCANIAKAIKLAQRNDLLAKPHESTQQWYIRLEQVLADSCATVRQQEVPE